MPTSRIFNTGVGRVVRPIKDHAANLEAILHDPDYNHVQFDISWDEVAKYIVDNPAATRITADLINRYPDRFLFGTDEVAPANQVKYTKVFYQYEPLWKLLNPDTSLKVRKGTTSGSSMKHGAKSGVGRALIGASRERTEAAGAVAGGFMLFALANGWCLLMLRGIAAVLMGLAALTEPGITLNVLALLYGAYALIDGGLALLEATSVFRSDERWGVLLVDSIAGMAAGLAAFSWPGITVEALIWVMARRAIVTGVAQTITAMRLRKCTTVEWLPALGGSMASVRCGADGGAGSRYARSRPVGGRLCLLRRTSTHHLRPLVARLAEE